MDNNPPPPPAKAKAGEQGSDQAKAEGGQPAAATAKTKAEGAQPATVTAKTKSGCLFAKATAKQPPETAAASSTAQAKAPELNQNAQSTTTGQPVGPSVAAQPATKKLKRQVRVLDMTPKPRKARKTAAPTADNRWGCPEHQSPDVECPTCQQLLGLESLTPAKHRHPAHSPTGAEPTWPAATEGLLPKPTWPVAHNTQTARLVTLVRKLTLQMEQCPQEDLPGGATFYGQTAATLPEDTGSDKISRFAEALTVFGVDPIVICHILGNEGLTSIDDFRVAFAGGNSAASFKDLVAAEINLSTETVHFPIKQSANLSRAWTKLEHCHGRALQQAAAPPDAADEDDPVPTGQIRALKDRYWEKYQVSLGAAEFVPSDRTISVVIRELQKRTLKVPNLRKVLSIQDDTAATRIKKDVGNGLHFMLNQKQDKEKNASTLQTYLQQLKLWFCALAIAGCTDVDNYPVDEQGRRRQQKQGEPSYLYTKIPLDQLTTYTAYIEKQTSTVDARQQFSWMHDRNTLTLEKACQLFRESADKPFGECLDIATKLHIGAWLPGIHERQSNEGRGRNAPGPRARLPRPALARPATHVKSKGKDKGKGKGKGKDGKGKRNKNGKTTNRASKMQNGKVICEKWNNGNCSTGDACPDAHVCNVLAGKSGRVCGMRNHKANEHTNKPK